VETFAWCGGAVLLKADYLRECGLFDRHFFLYYEDFDLSWRGRQLGWTYGYVPDSHVRHEHAYSSTAGSEFFEFWVDRNRRLALLKNAPAKVAARAVVDAIGATGRDSVKHIGQALARRRRPSPRWLLKRWRRLASLLKSCPAVLRERRALRRWRVVGDADIVRWMVTK
jgi:N-acetylglucosaminyl-diphospho-decaprenol L-rhamnosyltransferase